jgi:hypothetical protein
MRVLVGVLCVVAVAGCAGSSSPGGQVQTPGSSASSSADSSAVAVVVERYGDCLRGIGDTLKGQVFAESTAKHTIVGFGPKVVRFSVTHLNGKVYVTPVDARSALTLSRGGDTC